MSILSNIKAETKKSGTSKGKFVFFKENEKKRIRFLDDLEDGLEIIFHDSYEHGVNIPCQKMYDRDCEYCLDDRLRTRSLYCFSVYDYDSNEVRIFMQAVNNCSAMPSLVAFYESYGNIIDRDYVFIKTGKQQNTTFSVVPQDKVMFKNSKVKPLSHEAILKYLDKAYPDENAGFDSYEEDEDDEDYGAETKTHEKSNKKEKSTKQSKKGGVGSKKLREWEEEEIDDEEFEEEIEDWEEEEVDYSGFSAKELYEMCKEREIKCMPKKPAKFYIRLLEEDDVRNEREDW